MWRHNIFEKAQIKDVAVMNYNYAVLKKALACAVVFCLSAGVGALISKMIVTDEVLTPIALSFDDLSPSDFVLQISFATKVPLICMTVLFASGFTEFAFLVCITVSALRGASLGYSVAAVSNGSVQIINGAENSFFFSSALYVVSGVAMLCLGYFSLMYADPSLGNRFNGRAFAKYFVLFLILSGVVIICEAVRIIII